MQMMDMDTNWLDRLDMGFDFSDIMENPADDGEHCASSCGDMTVALLLLPDHLCNAC